MRSRALVAVLIVVLCALLGAATTYVSAWVILNLPGGRASMSDARSSPVFTKGPAPRSNRWGVSARATSVFGDAATGEVHVPAGIGRGPSWSMMSRPGPLVTSTVPLVSGELLERAAGWPMRAVVERMFSPMGQTPMAVPGHDWTMRKSNHVNPWMRLTVPFMPVWPGFAVNCGVFGMVWLWIIGWPVARRWMRAGVGCCQSCGYDLKGIAGEVCPECGGRSERAGKSDAPGEVVKGA